MTWIIRVVNVYLATFGFVGDKFSGEELGELVTFAHRRIYQLKKQLREQECMQEHRLKVRRLCREFFSRLVPTTLLQL